MPRVKLLGNLLRRVINFLISLTLSQFELEKIRFISLHSNANIEILMIFYRRICEYIWRYQNIFDDVNENLVGEFTIVSLKQRWQLERLSEQKRPTVQPNSSSHSDLTQLAEMKQFGLTERTRTCPKIYILYGVQISKFFPLPSLVWNPSMQIANFLSNILHIRTWSTCVGWLHISLFKGY